MLATLAICAVIALAVAAVSLGRNTKNTARNLAPFKKRALLNKTETRLANIVDNYARKHNLRLLAQVSYGEFLSTPDQRSYFRLNARRADLALTSRGFDVIAVIELLGSGHFGKTRQDRNRASESDAIKERAVTSAGIPFIFVQEDFTSETVIADLDKALGKEEAEIPA